MHLASFSLLTSITLHHYCAHNTPITLHNIGQLLNGTSLAQRRILRLSSAKLSVMADQVLELPCWPFALLLSSSLYFFHYPPGETSAEIPTVRFSRFLPGFINRLMFIFVAPYLIKYGYEKVPTCLSAHICHSQADRTCSTEISPTVSSRQMATCLFCLQSTFRRFVTCLLPNLAASMRNSRYVASFLTV